MTIRGYGNGPANHPAVGCFPGAISTHQGSGLRLAFTLAVVLALLAGTAVSGAADVTDSSDDSAAQNLGSIYDYTKDAGYASTQMLSYIPVLGISVFSDGVKLESGQKLNGLAVSSVDQWGPSYDAGIRAQRVKVASAATRIGGAVLLLGAAAIFPPAVLGIPLLANMDGLHAYDVIVAIDAERIRDINQLANSLRNAKPGEMIYLTIIRAGRRMQMQVLMPAVASSDAPAISR